MKKINKWMKPIGITALIMATIIVSNHVPANAGVVDNIQNSIAAILGHTDEQAGSSFVESSTNGKLNQMKLSVDRVSSTIDQMVSPYMSSLTVWVNDSNTAYNGMQVSIIDSKGKVKTASYVKRNGHYEADFSNILKGNYTISYPYIISGKTTALSTSTTLSAGLNKKQLYGDLFHMSIADIQACCKAGTITNIAKVGDTFSDGTYTYTIIGINQDEPSDASGNALSKSQYGDVLTVMPLGAPAGATNGQPVSMNANATPLGVNYAVMNNHCPNIESWALSQMRNTTMPQYLEKLPRSTQKAIGYVKKVTGTYSGSNEGENITTSERCFLLSSKEIFGGKGAWCSEKEANANIQYQYFQSIATTRESRNISNSTFSQWWWLRSPCSSSTFCTVHKGTIGNAEDSTGGGVFAAFCIY